MADDEVLEDLIDRLLVEACPQWKPPARVAPPGVDQVYWRFDRLEVTRLQLGQALGQQLGLAAERAEEILSAILHEPSLTSQLVHPLISAIGRRTVLERLIIVVGDGDLPWGHRVNAASAAYWVRCWEPPQRRALLRAAYGAGARSHAEFEDYLQRHQAPPRLVDKVEDLWPRLWQVCLAAFVACDDAEARRDLQTAFPLDPSCYPSESNELLAMARHIAREDPSAFDRLLGGSTGYGWSI
jgi:hypothetical protein